jgi:predicted ABC-type exoprotein transport system permease subunit
MKRKYFLIIQILIFLELYSCQQVGDTYFFGSNQVRKNYKILFSMVMFIIITIYLIHSQFNFIIPILPMFPVVVPIRW